LARWFEWPPTAGFAFESREAMLPVRRVPPNGPSTRSRTPWREIEQTLDTGHDVTLLRGGRPWATISPA
jgi:hypothetical protein